ncbi:hypothetical protein pEaSNUABM38_00115 [Erwinia phage pEa_SNUABM_38]|nr:hypothetical protein pEaSNUABM38_00115 [Erwinia phage pEa_SNUABM_38]
MSDKIVPFAPRPANGAVADKPAVEGDGVVAEFKDYDTGRIEVPQPDGSTKSIIFSIDMVDWWMALSERFIATMPEGPYGRAFVGLNKLEHACTDVFTNRKRHLEMEITRQQFEQFVQAVPCQLMETEHRTCQLSVAEFAVKYAEDTVCAKNIPADLVSAIFLYQVDGERFRIHYVEQ